MDQRGQKPVNGAKGAAAAPIARPTLPVLDETDISEKTPYNEYMRTPYMATKSPPPVYHTPYSEYNTPSPYQQQYDDQYYQAESGYNQQNPAYHHQYEQEAGYHNGGSDMRGGDMRGGDMRGGDMRGMDQYQYTGEDRYYDDRNYYQHHQAEQRSTGEAYAMTTYHTSPKPASAPVLYNEVPAPQAYTMDNHTYFEPHDVRARSLADSSHTSPRQQHSAATPTLPTTRLPRGPQNSSPGNYF
jgi:hypothetical protein